MENLQGELKELTRENYEKLKNQILTLGFSAPFFVWKHDNHNYLTDGVQRKRTLTSMREEGYIIPDLPCVLIYANNEKEAKKKILAISSQYGKMTDQGLYEFISDSEIEFKELDNFRLPDIDIDRFKFEYIEDNIIEKVNKGNEIDEWVNLPDFNPKSKDIKLIIIFNNENDRKIYVEKNNIEITSKFSNQWSCRL